MTSLFSSISRSAPISTEKALAQTGASPKGIGTYLYDETNRMVQGTNKDGETSLYTFIGLDVLVGIKVSKEPIPALPEPSPGL